YTIYYRLSLFHETPPSHLYTLSLHDALPISPASRATSGASVRWVVRASTCPVTTSPIIRSPTSVRCRAPGSAAASGPTDTSTSRSEEHTSELQSLRHLVCRLLLEKKKKKNT